MEPFTLLVASGLRTRLDSLEMLANNLANLSTPGFKLDREFYSVFITQTALANVTPDPTSWPGLMPVLQRQYTDFRQGELQQTGSPLDLALAGPGFFTVQGPQQQLYTRNGHFSLSPNGTLVTAEGYPVLLEDGSPVTIPPGAEIKIAQDGTVTAGGLHVGRLLLVDFPDKSVLVKVGYSYFRNLNPTVEPQPANQVRVHQGMLEASNVNPAVGMVRLIEVMRQFEMLQRALLAHKDVNRRALQELSRIE